MKKSLLIVFLAITFFQSAKAQFTASNPAENTFYQGYLIKLVPAGVNGFGYDIFFKTKMVAHQLKNPFTLSPAGINSKEEALKVAKWQVKQLGYDNRSKFIIKNRLLPKSVAEQLGISIH